MNDNPGEKTFYILLFVLALAVNLAGINVGFFTDDQGLYAAIAKNMVYKKDFLQLFTYNQDWLDKPHFPFWAILVSFKLFGISVWAYRLPALFFFIISLVYTFLFTRKYYSWQVAATAVLILMTAQHVLLSNTDVRAEPYLMALVIGSIYHISRLEERFTISDLLMAALLTACAIMTKGIFVIVAIGGSLLWQLIFQKKFKSLFSLKWIALFILTLVFTLPEFYALYLQFDVHPEKVVFGTQHVSGIKWFLWDSQFGRFVNNGPINRKATGSVFFFLHTLLWAFAPWCLLFYFAVYKNVKAIIHKIKLPEYYALTGGLLLLLLFSLSRFQLPFYTNTVFPLFAVITAPFCCRQLSGLETKLRQGSHWLFIIALPLVIVLVNYLLKPVSSLFFVADVMLFGLMIFIINIKVKEYSQKLFMLGCSAALFAGFYLNTVFYNEITPYKGQISAAAYISQKPFDNCRLYTFRSENNVFQFYCKRPVEVMPIEKFNTLKNIDRAVFYADQRSMEQLVQSRADFRVIKTFVNYPQENILPKFINRATRPQTLGLVYLIVK
ncbi:hypothetical protein BH09BAC6_BH09BAC6_13200 [soil metagenome]